MSYCCYYITNGIEYRNSTVQDGASARFVPDGTNEVYLLRVGAYMRSCVLFSFLIRRDFSSLQGGSASSSSLATWLVL